MNVAQAVEGRQRPQVLRGAAGRIDIGSSKRLTVMALVLAVAVAPAPWFPIVAKESREAPQPERLSDQVITPKEMFERLEASKTQYVFAPPEGLRDVETGTFADVFWPQGKALALPKVSRSQDGGHVLTVYPVPDEAAKSFNAGEALFEAKKYDEAAIYYSELVGRFPDYYRAWVYVGDAHFFAGRYTKALEAYIKAIELNPHDYQGHLFKGHALLKLGRRDEALEEWVRTLALRPHNPSAIMLLTKYVDALNIELHDERFEPRAVVRREGDAVKIYTPADTSWLTWANCKALWLGEPSYRKERTGKEDHGWTSTEDWECLRMLYVTRSLAIEDKNVQPDPVLDRVTLVGDAGFLFQMMTYDIVSRVVPDAMLLLPDHDLAMLEAYIRRYVVVSRTKLPR